LEALKTKILYRKATAAVIGLGYVGLPLALEIASAGFKVVGIDVDPQKIAPLKSGKSYVHDAADEATAEAIASGRFLPTSDFAALRDVDTVSICVPTPLSKSRDPDISFILSATEEIRKYLHPGQLVVLESTNVPRHYRRAHFAGTGKHWVTSWKGFLSGFFTGTNRSR
jgi:UDP-N-acetyl-D-glucosamine dehydrogenase